MMFASSDTAVIADHRDGGESVKGKPSESWGRKVNGLRDNMSYDSVIAGRKWAQCDAGRQPGRLCSQAVTVRVPGRLCPVSRPSALHSADSLRSLAQTTKLPERINETATLSRRT